MRRTAVAAAAVLFLASCGGGDEKPEPPEPGPLVINSGYISCTTGIGAGRVIVSVAADGNTAEIPLTIDEVSLVGAENAVLDEALVGKHPAVDATIAEKTRLGGNRALTLHLTVPDAAQPTAFDSVAVDYHNVDGRFRALSASFAFTNSCLP